MKRIIIALLIPAMPPIIVGIGLLFLIDLNPTLPLEAHAVSNFVFESNILIQPTRMKIDGGEYGSSLIPSQSRLYLRDCFYSNRSDVLP